MKDLLEKIRAKVIEANPEIESRIRWTKVDPQFDGTDKGVEERLPAPIRLADVLLAINRSDQRKQGHEWVISTAGQFCDISRGYRWEAVLWNVENDDLEKQSEETLEFLAKVLNV